jgi:hypothetical protein
MRGTKKISGRQRRQSPGSHTKTNGWKNILNTLTLHYCDRIAASSIN